MKIFPPLAVPEASLAQAKFCGKFSKLYRQALRRDPMSFFNELKKRNVFKVSLAYLALGWAVIAVTTTVTPQMNPPEWLPSRVVWIGIIAFSFVAVFSWIYELTPDGLNRESEISQWSRGDLVDHLRLPFAGVLPNQ